MIDFVVNFVVNQLEEHLERYTTGIDVESANISDLNNINNKVIVTLVNIEEEYTLTNQKYTRKVNNQLIKKEPSIVLNLFLLVSFGMTNYNNRLFQMTRTLEFFQKNKIFTPSSHPELRDQDIDRLVFKLFTMDMEQLNDMWSMLGGKFHTSVLYKVRLVEVDAKLNDGIGPAIEEIELETKLKNA